jgi:hypothetical protein
MGKPKAPDAPDYAAAANAQGSANVNSAVATNRLNQVNQTGPYGSLTYSYGTQENGDGYTDPQTGQWIPQVTASTTLSPDQQRLLDQNNQLSIGLNDLAGKGLGYVDQATSSPLTGNQFDPLKTGLGTMPAIQTGLDYSGVAKIPGQDDFSADRDKVVQALMARNKPFLDQQRSAAENKLANQGINQGSEAWGYNQTQLGQNENDAAMAALLAGSQEQNRLFNQGLAAHQTGTQDVNTQGTFANTAANQAFNQGLASNQFSNAARAQAIQEADYFKNQPLNMLNALRSGNQVTTPQFGNVSGGAQIQAAPIYQATSDQYQSALDAYKAQMASSGGLLGGLATLGSSAITKFSDRRLKTNIVRIGQRPDGLGLYSYDYVFGGSDIGVMADEVARLRPEALGPTILGYATVNYGKL